MPELLGGLVANLKQNHRQAGERRGIRLIGSDFVQRHYIPVVVHPGLLKRLSSARNVKAMTSIERRIIG
ncbi:hypothetical protein D3C84_1025640 [compost metagenome]